MKKNLLLLHLESLNSLIYQMNPEMFPVLTEMEKQCCVFDRYYSTATSTLMVIGDLLYGGMKLYEQCESLDSVPAEYCYSSSLFDDLKEKGYNTGIYIYPEGGNRKSAEKKHLAGFQNEMKLIRDYSQYIDTFAHKMERQPFALMACNYISNLSLNGFLDANRYGIDADYWMAGYQCMDQCCGELLQLLKDKGLMDKTLIVFYGDHGDDYWGHGMHGGLTHAIEPNSLLIHTPLFIWDGVRRKEALHDIRLLQTTDLKRLICTLLEGKSTKDLLQRKYVISRNEYAAQPVRAESFNKAYSVTEGRYMLMISSKGLELYDTKMDPACQNNVLRFFDYKDGLLKENDQNIHFFRFHFQSYWSSRQQRILRKKFYELINVLHDKVLELYRAGGRNEADMLEEMKFSEISR